jgi:transcriptional regulator with XRE-family HTH domain
MVTMSIGEPMTRKSPAFAQWLRGVLSEHRWNKSEFASRVGVSTSMVSRWIEREERPSTGSVRLIARALREDDVHLLHLAGHASDVTVTEDLSPEKVALIARIRRSRGPLSPKQVQIISMLLDDYEPLDQRPSAAGEGPDPTREP